MKFVPNVITRTVGTSVLQAKKNSPTIFFVGGVIGTVGATVLACRATLKLHDTLDEIKEEVADVTIDGEEATRDQYLDVLYVYGKSALKIGKLYGPSIVLGSVSIMALTGSHVTLVRRNAALSATLAAVSKAYDDYRTRVREEIGEERELDLYHDLENKVVKQDDGSKKVVKVANSAGFSPYAVVFDESNINWEKNSEYNKLFLTCQAQYLNYKFHARGHMFLNEVYEALGFEHTQAGSVVGWVLEEDGDNYIDIGLFNGNSKNNEFVNNMERSIWLDFNVDGVIFDKIGK